MYISIPMILLLWFLFFCPEPEEGSLTELVFQAAGFLFGLGLVIAFAGALVLALVVLSN